MELSEFNADLLSRNQGMLNSTLADFSDADMLIRPCPGANHAAWQLGHLIGAETRIINGAKPGAIPELPAGFAGQFTKETAGKDEPSAFTKKQVLLDQFARVRAASIAWVKTLTPADMDQPAPANIARMAPTVAHLVELLCDHTTMHVGQFQVIRRKLGKPVLF